MEAVDLADARLQDVTTLHGKVRAYVAENFVFLRRHGEKGYHPPHRIPHHAHVLAMESLGVRRVAGLASTGALDPELSPGDIVVPEDYLSWHPPPTFAGDEYLHIVPAFDVEVRQLLVRAARAAVGRTADAGALTEGGVYAETRGPRFETRAEIRLLAEHARVVGMTAASEATLFQERGIGYAVLCLVDNWANGIGPEPLTLEAFQEQLARNASLARRILIALIALWHTAPAAARLEST